MAKPASARHEALGAAIRGTRKDRGITQEELALESGLDRSYLGAVERGEYNVTYTTILRIADTLGLAGSDLLARAEATQTK